MNFRSYRCHSLSEGFEEDPPVSEEDGGSTGIPSRMDPKERNEGVEKQVK